MKKLILITGMPGSGKTSVAKIIGEHGFPIIFMGDVVRKEAEARGIGGGMMEMSKFMVELRKELGEEAVAKLTYDEVEEVDGEIVVVDGIRSPKEVEYFKSKCHEAILVGVLAPLGLRYNRLSNRNRIDDPKTIKELEGRDMVELQVGLGEAIALSDIYILNEGDLEDLRRAVRKKILISLSNRPR